MSERKSRRAGGREARVALRAAPLAEDIKPIRGGMEGGRYKPLTDEDIARIHDTALQALEEIGLADAPETGVEAMRAFGAEYRDGRLYFPRKIVMKALEMANKDFILHGQDPKHDIHPVGNKVYYGTAGAAVHVVDVEGRNYPESTMPDLYDAARIVDGLENIHYFQRCMVCRDIPDNVEMDLNTMYAAVRGTTKHVGTSFFGLEQAHKAFDMLHLIAGSEEAWRARPFVSLSNTFVVPPFKFATESCEAMEVCIRGGMPVLLLSAGQAGATSPAAIAGAVTQAVAECLAGVVYVNAIMPGHPAVFGTWPFVSDLRTGAMSGGSGEQSLLSAACAQMHKHYGLPGGTAAGMADAKLPDMQAGYEKGITNVMAGLAGANLVYESAGMHASLLGWCHETAIIDNDLLGQCMRCVRGIEVNDSTLSLDVMKKTCLEGPGHYLGSEQTLSLMQTDYVYPVLGDRSSPKEWAELGKPDLVQKAIDYKNKVLSTYHPSHIPDEVDDAIRDQFAIHMTRKQIGRVS